MTSLEGAIVPITLTVNGRTGLTLWAPPWEDADGEEWQGFLGDGAKILLFPSTRELADFIVTGEENDLSDHPAWGRIQKLTPDELRPTPEDDYDLDAVYEWAGAEPDPATVSALANVVDMVGKIADCCDDGALRRLIEGTPEYADLVESDVSYQGKEGRKAWNALGDVVAESWERALTRVEGWLNWRGDFTTNELAAETTWDRIGASPIKIVLRDATWLTVRATDPGKPGVDDDSTIFIGGDDTVAVFSDAASLAQYCRTAEEHRLVELEGWSDVTELDDDDFEPDAADTYDLRKPSTAGADLVRELTAFTQLDADLTVLDRPNVDRDDWRELVDQVASCFEPQD